MDSNRFDALTRTFATSSRRRVLRLAGGGALGALFGRAGLEAAAQPSTDANDVICENEPLLCNREGRPAGNCGRDCRCARATNGDRKCVDVSGATCENRRRCNRERDCRRGEVCVKVRNCTDEACQEGRQRGRCFDKCAS